MKFSDKIENLQEIEENRGKIIFIKCGIFMIALGKDATLLHNILGLKVTCWKEGVCKVGVPVNQILKYLNFLDNSGYAYAVYDYDKKTKKFELKYSHKGKENQEKEKCLNCNICKYNEEHNEYNNWSLTELLEKKVKPKQGQKNEK